ncbi:hypothetical protein BGX34_008246 [Mortierella sp. NVP85]|nr:hypothetical protein BGX34_008246 [Mortierella sp. NVP85]
MFDDGKGLFAMASGMGFTYNLTSDIWIEVSNSNFASMRSTTATSDLESGIIYVPNNFPDFSGMRVMYSFDMNTKKYNTTTMYSDTGAVETSPIAWSAFLQSILFLPSDEPILHVFTPSKAGTSSGGWDSLNTTGENDWIDIPTCFVSAYGGSKMVVFSGKDTQSAVYILDVATLVWKKGPSIPKLTFAACAVSGDQFILWSGHTTNSTGQHEISNRTLLYSMKTETWVSDYTPPPPTSLESSCRSARRSFPYALESPNSQRRLAEEARAVMEYLLILLKNKGGASPDRSSGCVKGPLGNNNLPNTHKPLWVIQPGSATYRKVLSK